MVSKKNKGLYYNCITILRGLFFSDFHLFLIYTFYSNLLLSIYFYIKVNKIFSYICLLIAMSQYIMGIIYDERYKKLEKKIHLLSNCFDSLPSLFVIFDKNWDVVFANDIFQAFSIGKTLKSFDDVLECFNENEELCNLLKTGQNTLLTENHYCENLLIDANKSWRIYLGILKKSYKNFYVCYISDIQEINLKKEQNIQNVLQEFPEGVCIFDKNKKEIIFINKYVENILHILNLNLHKLAIDIQEFLERKRFSLYYKNNEEPNILQFEKIKETDIIIFRVLSNEAIIKYMSIYNDTQIGILLVNNDFTIIESNNKFNNLVNSYFVKKTNLLQYIYNLQHNILKQYFKDKKNKDIPPINVNIGDITGNFVKLYGECLDNYGWIICLQDNNIQQELESQLLHMQRLGLLGQVLSAVSHDFNNILTAITGFCEVLCLRIPLEDDRYFSLIQIKHNINRAVNLVKYILYLSKKNIPTCEVETNINDTTSHLLSNMGRLFNENIVIDFIKNNQEIIAQLPSINLEQILLNLFVNARDAMPDGGIITISTTFISDISLVNINNEVVKNTTYMELVVTDTGGGISTPNKSKIFDAFFTTKKEGTGLGLSTIYSIVKQFHGFIIVNSKLKVGTTFKIYLPAFEKKTNELSTKEENLTFDIQKKKFINVILVEDDLSIRTLLKTGFQTHKYLNITAFSSTKEALNQARLLLKEGKKLDLIISDIMISDGNGLELVEKIRKLTDYTKFILISGHDYDYLENLSGFSVFQTNSQDIVFLKKPFTLHEMNAIINSFFNL
jgi:signal transduction histidine kinase